MRHLCLALSFLTILPLGPKETKPEELSGSIVWFPLVGALLGGIYYLISFYLSNWVPAMILAWLVSFLMVVLTGGIHLDGLGDWADGLGKRKREEILRVMKEPSLGSFGVIAILLLVLGKFASIFTIIEKRGDFLAFVSAPVLARWAMAFLLCTSSYARKEAGLGLAFSRGGNLFNLIIATFIGFGITLLLDLRLGAIYIFLSLFFSLLIRAHSIRRIGGITGDVLGALGEMIELFVLVSGGVFSEIFARSF